MNSGIKFVFLLLSLFTIQSCIFDCPNIHEGHVYDKISGKPIENVNVLGWWDTTVINNYGLVHDTIPKKQRQFIMKKEGGNEWWDNNDGTYKMVKSAPLFTDSLGLYRIVFMTGKCPKHYRLIFLKSGYIPYVTSELRGGTNFDIYMVKIEEMIKL